MTMTLRNPEAPATSKQLWLLHILTKTDTRNLNITMLEASNRIEALKSNNGKRPQGDTARADYRVSGIRPMVNPHASYIAQDKQKLAQARYDKSNPQPERQVIQGVNPLGETDMVKIKTHFMANAYELGRVKAGNDTANIDFYDFNCKECLFGKMGVCEPDWQGAGFTTCQGIVESVSFSCRNYEPVKHSIMQYCHRPHGKQCHRKQVDNKCLECNYRKTSFRDGGNHSAWCDYIPTIQARIADHNQTKDLFLNPSEHFKDIDHTESIRQTDNIIRLLNKLVVVQ